MTQHEYPSDSTAARSESSDEWYEVPRDAANAEPISVTVTEAVSAVTGTDPRSLRPLYEVIDPDALDRLFSPAAGSPARKNGEARVAFRYEGRLVRVFEDGRVFVSLSGEK